MTFLVPHRYKLEDEGVFIDAIKYAFTEEELSDLIETMIKEHKTGIMLYGFKLFFDSEWRIVMLDVEFVNTKTMLNIRPEKIANRRLESVDTIVNDLNIINDYLNDYNYELVYMNYNELGLLALLNNSQIAGIEELCNSN